MYEEFYQLHRTPFTRDIPSDQLYMTPALQEMEARLEYVSAHHLFAVLTGDCGTGKSTILRKLSDTLDPRHYRMLYVSESKLTPRNFYRLLLEQLGVQAKSNCANAKRQLHEKLSVMRAVDGISTVCVVDESHLLSFEMLEEIRFLLNMKFDSESPISLILSGQPELWNKLKLQKCEAIQQRINIRCFLNHYDLSDTKAYIEHQMTCAGAASSIFTDEAVRRIFEYSTGIPRMINNLCSSVLIYGYQNKMRLIDDHAVQTVLEGEYL